MVPLLLEHKIMVSGFRIKSIIGASILNRSTGLLLSFVSIPHKVISLTSVEAHLKVFANQQGSPATSPAQVRDVKRISD